MIIGFAGKKQSGKSTAAKVLQDEFGFEVRSFAATLKRMANVMLADVGMLPEAIEYFQQRKEDVIPMLGVSYRHITQTLGTDWGRRHVHEDLWVLAASNFQPDALIVFDDVRFENEARMIRDSGGIIVHLIRPGPAHNDAHASEQGIGYVPGDVRIDNNSSGGNFTALITRWADCVLAGKALAAIAPSPHILKFKIVV